jgi:prepilin-type N-terminal cleavage/methylation domain-containing protein
MTIREKIRACSSRTYRANRANQNKKARGFTLIEILVVIGMLAILTTVVLVAVNPLRQFAQARNSQRESNVAALLNAVTNRIADNGGVFVSSTTEITDSHCTALLPLSPTDISKSQIDIRDCLVPNYLPELPYDPSNGSNTCLDPGCQGSGEDYDLDYTIRQDTNTNRVTICAPSAAEAALPNSTTFCLSR